MVVMSDHNYRPTIGLEIHAELKTKTKMFCQSKNDPDEERPNVNICPVCLAHPGTLPVINKEAVKHVLKVGYAVKGTIADFTEFDRKNYFYPDIPKDYQISQYQYPLVAGGELDGVALTRIHLEEDTARSNHSEGNYSLVDFNRAGVPLMELVTEPVITTASQAGHFARELQLLLRTLGVALANMEKGEMRVEANISVSDSREFGTKVEVKNLNSFRAVEKAIAYEIERQVTLLEAGEQVEQETRGWDEAKQITFSQRKKESSNDYRYFPDPDLPKLKISEVKEFSPAVIMSEIPELPNAHRARLAVYDLKEEDVEAYVADLPLSNFFDAVSEGLGGNPKQVRLASNYITSDLLGILKSAGRTLAQSKVTPESVVTLVKMLDEGEISSRGAKDILAILHAAGGDPRRLATEKNLLQESDEGALLEIARQIVSENSVVAEDYRAGKESALQFFVGQGMKATKGAANPQVLQNAFRQVLAE
jgi:aspartyl-tRNA(Asn)/glutamyl-tRNA(Gln) amidotransferase subunit B